MKIIRVLAKILIPVFYVSALILPGYIFFTQRAGLTFLQGIHGRDTLTLIFPLFGLYAFTLIVMQILIATNAWWLRSLFPRAILYHRIQGSFALLFAILHPLFILIGYGLATTIHFKYVSPENVRYVVLADIAWLLLFSTVSTALLVWSGRKIPWWYSLHRLNYLVFALVWLHSWFIGSDVQTTNLKYLWIIYLALVILSVGGKYLHPQNVSN